MVHDLLAMITKIYNYFNFRLTLAEYEIPPSSERPVWLNATRFLLYVQRATRRIDTFPGSELSR